MDAVSVYTRVHRQSEDESKLRRKRRKSDESTPMKGRPSSICPAAPVGRSYTLYSAGIDLQARFSWLHALQRQAVFLSSLLFLLFSRRIERR